MADPGPMLTEREHDRVIENARALAYAIAPTNPVTRRKVRDALVDAYMAGLRRDAAQPRASL